MSHRVRRPLRLLLLVLLLTGLVSCGRVQHPPPHQQKLTPPAQLVGRFHHYVALGDSYTSAPYVPVMVQDSCYRSDHNYPSLVARSLRIADFADRSCGGAKTANLTSPQPKTDAPPQFTALRKDTDLVTVGIGANDAGIAKTVMGVCQGMATVTRHGAPCRKLMRAHGPDKLLSAIPAVGGRVASLLRQVHRRSPHARVVLVGYPRLAPAHGTCKALPLATGDYAYVNQVLHTLDRALRRAAHTTGTTWVDPWPASRGHDICSDHPWIEGAFADPNRAAAYHPFGNEQVAVARLVEHALARPSQG
ncbi:MAG: SGNH/GDSL hydrolase family protein [Marmoricola sp.]